MDLNSKNCDVECPIGQFTSLVSRGRCEFCAPSCSVCTAQKCLICASSFLNDPQGNCYRCNCADCGVCPNKCPFRTLFFKNNCYGACPQGSFKQGNITCAACK